MRVVLLVRSLARGGAERQLVMLARGLTKLGVHVTVVAFYDGGAFEADLVEAGIRVVSLHKAGRWDVPSLTIRLFRVLRAERPDVLYGFVVTPNLLGTALKPFFPALRVVWGIRSARMDLSAYDWVTRTVYHLERRLSRLPDLIIVNSKAGRRFMHERGFPDEKVRYVPNGIDVERYRPDPEGRERLRREWDLKDGQFLVGMVGRADPVKAHDVFLQTAKLLIDADPRLVFRCIGIDPPAAAAFGEQIARLGISERLRVDGPRDDLAAVYSALDVHVMCSHSEGFPNVVAEAMACGVPCAVTNAGDAVEIVGEIGEHAPPGDPPALALAIQKLISRLELQSASMQAAARRQIVERYSIAALASRTLGELNRLVPPTARVNEGG